MTADLALVWAACDACLETWSVAVHPDWLPPEDAAKEVARHADSQLGEHRCPVRRGVTVGLEP